MTYDVKYDVTYDVTYVTSLGSAVRRDLVLISRLWRCHGL